jgi:AcrR family transcriptional regulator
VSRASEGEARETILRVVVELLGEHGYDGVQLREVARRAHVSLSRIYQLHGTRDALLVDAVRRWMAEHAYATLEPTDTLEPSPSDAQRGLMQIFQAVFEPWEREPRMLEVFHRARLGPGGQELVEQATAAIRPALHAVLEGADAAYVRDVELLLFNLLYAVFGRFADGELAITEILPTLERAAVRLTADNRAAISGSSVSGSSSRARPATSAGRRPRSRSSAGC